MVVVSPHVDIVVIFEVSPSFAILFFFLILVHIAEGRMLKILFLLKFVDVDCLPILLQTWGSSFFEMEFVYFIYLMILGEEDDQGSLCLLLLNDDFAEDVLILKNLDLPFINIII